jgi:xanthine dehydrogenase YagT iron-sulfur-binding subunit
MGVELPALSDYYRAIMETDPRRRPEPREAESGLTRRDAIRQGLLLGASLMVGPTVASAQSAATPVPLSPDLASPANYLHVRFQLNGGPVQAEIESRVTLLDLLRENLGLPGTKKGCDHGQCGACTVLIDGRRVLSCLTLAATVENKAVTTIEGLAQGGELHPLQSAFIAHDAFQCGFCTSGQIMSAAGFLREPGPATPDAIREGMSGNLCRCGAYGGIVAAIGQVGKSPGPRLP